MSSVTEDLIRKKFRNAALHELNMRRNGEEIDALAARAFALVKPELEGLKKGFEDCLEEYDGTVKSVLTLEPAVVEKCDYEKSRRGAKLCTIRLEARSGGISGTAEFHLIAAAYETQEKCSLPDGGIGEKTIRAFSYLLTDESRNLRAESRGWAESIFDSAETDGAFREFWGKVADEVFQRYRGFCEKGPSLRDSVVQKMLGNPRSAP